MCPFSPYSFSLIPPLSSEIKVLEADMLDLPFGDECFDVVIEKGTMVTNHLLVVVSYYLQILVFAFFVLIFISSTVCNLKDVLLVDGGDPWNPQPSTRAKVMAMLEGVHRVLKKDGIFVSITFGQVLE